MRLLLIPLLAACSSTRPYGEDLPEGTLCATVEGEEICAEADAIVARRTAQGFDVRAAVTVSGMQIGYELAEIGLVATVRDGEADSYLALAPVAVDCFTTIVHGDHCDTDILVPMACALEGEERLKVTIDALTSDHVYARFDGKIRVDRPPCCESFCPGWDVPPEVDPKGPYRVAGVVHARFTEE